MCSSAGKILVELMIDQITDGGWIGADARTRSGPIPSRVLLPFSTRLLEARLSFQSLQPSPPTTQPTSGRTAAQVHTLPVRSPPLNSPA
jgi:hypothetical protein